MRILLGLDPCVSIVQILEFVDLGLEVVHVICEDDEVIYICCGCACVLEVLKWQPSEPTS